MSMSIMRSGSAHILSHVRSRLASAVRRESPFPHVWVERLLPDEAYDALASAWPPLDAFWADEASDVRLDLVPKPPGTAPADARARGYEGLPEMIREQWDRFLLEVNRGVIGPFLEGLFAPEIRERFDLLDGAAASGAHLAPYLTRPYRPQMNVGRLMMRGQGYRLRPHVDALAYLATALFYFPTAEDPPGDLGTTLYGVERPLDPAALLDRGKTAYFHKAGIAVQPVATMPFAGNTLLAFANTGSSAHGVDIQLPGWRRAFQSHLSLKADTDHL